MTSPRRGSSWPRPANPKGFDAGDYYCDASYANLGEAVINYLKAAGIRAQLRPLERAAFILQNSQKKLRNIIQTASGAFGNAATRLDAFVAAAGGTFTYGTYPDIEGLLQEQASEMDGKKREAILQRIQQLIHEKAMVAPIWELALLNGHGPRVAESGLTLITNHAYSAPYQDVKLKGKCARARPAPLVAGAGPGALLSSGGRARANPESETVSRWRLETGPPRTTWPRRYALEDEELRRPGRAGPFHGPFPIHPFNVGYAPIGAMR